MLTRYITSRDSEFKSDNYEKVGNVLLKPLRLICGRTVKIDHDSKISKLPTANKLKRMAVATFSSIFFLITVPSLILGALCISQSKSYKQFKALDSTYQKKHIQQPQKTKKSELVNVDLPSSQDKAYPSDQFPAQDLNVITSYSSADFQELAQMSPKGAPAQIIDSQITQPEIVVDDTFTLTPFSLEIPNEYLTAQSESAPYSSLTKVCALGILTLLSISTAYYGATITDFTDYTPFINKMNKLFAEKINKESFDNLIGPVASIVGLPFIRSGCYVSAMSLAAQKVAQGITSIVLSFIPKAKSLEKRVCEAFNRHLARDICLIIGLIGTGILIEGVESDLNLYLQKLAFNQSQNIVDDMQNVYVDESQSLGATPSPIEEYFKTLELLTTTGIYSMKRMRLTPLESRTAFEMQFENFLILLGLSKEREQSLLTKFFYEIDFTKSSQDIKKSLTLKSLSEKAIVVLKTLNSTFAASVKFMEAPFENTRSYLNGHVIKRLLAWKLYSTEKFSKEFMDYNSYTI